MQGTAIHFGGTKMVDWQGRRRLRRPRGSQSRVNIWARGAIVAAVVMLCASWAGAALADGGDGGNAANKPGGAGGTGFTPREQGRRRY